MIDDPRLHEGLADSPVTSLDPFGIYSAIRDACGRIVDFRVEYVNEAAVRANGIPREQQIGRTVLEILPQHRDTGLFDIYCRVIETGEPFEADEFLFTWATNPERRWFDIRAARYGDGFAAAWRDVTWRKEAEESLRRSREHLQFVTNALAVSVAHCSADLRFLFVNRTYAERLGLTPDQIAGRTIEEVLGREALDSLRPYIDRALAGESLQYEIEVDYGGLTGIGRRFLHCAYTPERDEEGRVAGWVAAVTDLTERHRLEETLRQNQEELKEADRRKDEFLATLAHELRNPLAPIRNAAQILRLKEPEDAESRWARDVIDRQVQQLTRLVDDLLDVSRITRGKIELRRQRVDLSDILERALETSRPAIESARHRLTVSFPDESLRLVVDPTRMAQVLSNLINNAAKYTRPGGHIEIYVWRDGPQAVVDVRDDGLGIEPEMLSRIFELFAQADTSLERAQGGLGIGLTIARSLVEMHGGILAAASDGLGKGSVFTLRLPLAADEDTDGAPEHDRHRQAGAGFRILVVDDNADSADSLAVWLRLKGNDVRTAYDGLHALEEARAYRPELILLDIGMPGMSGYEVARRLRDQPETCAATLVATTGWGQEDDRRQSKEAGFDQHLVKPLEPKALEELLARLTGPRR